MTSMTPLEKKAIDTMRALAMDAVQQAKSGHPGAPMALAPIAYMLYNERMNYDPKRPNWPNRDRFILSNGHASALLYSVLHVAGVKALSADGEPTDQPAVSLDDLKSFRQLGSKCPGHPEYGRTSGVEMTTGPLGAGIASSVGFAMARVALQPSRLRTLFRRRLRALRRRLHDGRRLLGSRFPRRNP